MAVDRVQWGAEAWQVADLYMPEDPSPFQKDEGVPCVMLIHGGFWKEQYTLDLMQPIAEDLAEAGVAAWNIEFKRWAPGEEGVWMDTLSDVLRAWGHLALIPGIDIMRSMVMGHSAGGHLALLMGAKAERRPWPPSLKPPSRTSSAPTAPNFRTRATPCADGLAARLKKTKRCGGNSTRLTIRQTPAFCCSTVSTMWTCRSNSPRPTHAS